MYRLQWSWDLKICRGMSSFQRVFQYRNTYPIQLGKGGTVAGSSSIC